MRWGFSGIAVLFLFFGAGLFVPLDSPPLPAAFIVLVFIVLPIVVLTPLVAFRLKQCKRDRVKGPPPPWRYYDTSGSAPAFTQMAGLGAALFGISALIRALALKQPVGIPIFFLGGGVAAFLGVVVFYAIDDDQKS
jgi:hypothetical protein